MTLLMNLDKTKIKRILLITLSNIGDVVLTTPVVNTLVKEFQDARIDIMVGPNGKGIFENDPRISKLIIYDKRLPLSQKRRLQLKLLNLRYDLVVDLRNTIFPLIIGAKYRTSSIMHFADKGLHSAIRHLSKLKSIGIQDFQTKPYIHIPDEDELYVSNLLKEDEIKEPIVVVSPGAKSHLKMWPEVGYAEVCERLIEECKASVVLVGIENDRYIASKIISYMKRKPHDLVNRTNVRQLASLIRKSRLLITNDSAPLHIGCAVNAKVLAIFGPTDPAKYGPTGEFDMVISNKLSCSPCENATCKRNYECMKLIPPGEVFDAAKLMLEGYE